MIRLNHRKTKEEQFSEKITEIQNKLYRLAYCYVKNEQEALDIVSEAVYKGFIAYGKIESMTYFDSWMSRIVINTAIDHIRRNQRVTYMEDHAQEFVAPERGASLEEKMDLYDALDRLIPEEKAYIILKFFVNLPFREMAEVLSIPENTVKSKFYRIIKKLKIYLIEGEVENV
ncbi:sigma-70 family RNA polymerase sigma factor [Paenibacillus sp. W2I17]|uniref:sigma-70 family RNA polymerase sigma factor n=1 Tax=Paenibacillus sp. W2I17 TaxID=3042311 RepID=UPI002781DB0B|nr:sigma-70 family RNA polymerase sigma factor [Paenibacillus sp. W2I17]MDQ0659012.1 RNA polymerase sigma-70 factor (ECF subfamily) [Paenibacillus sp. W2I17]